MKQIKTETLRPSELIDRSVIKKPFELTQSEVKKLGSSAAIIPPSSNVKAQTISERFSSAPSQSSKCEDLAELRDSGIHISLYPQTPIQKPAPSKRSVNIDIDIDEESAFGLTAADKKAQPKQEAAPIKEKQTAPPEEKREVISLISEKPAEQPAQKHEEIQEEIQKEIHEEIHEEKEETPTLVDLSGDRIRFVGEAFRTYIIIEKNDELVLIDKHALHERIIYEKLRREQGKKYAQFLLEPAVVSLSKEQYGALLEKKELMEQSGFEIEDFGSGTILVRTAPSFIDAYDVAATVEEMSDRILENKSDIESEYTDWLYHNIACRSAIKGGDKSSPQELVDLYMKMGEDPSYRYCPHGRPTSIVMTKYQLEKQFGRLG